jgi:hypothetical protein
MPQFLSFSFGLYLITITITSAIRTFILPRAISDRLTAFIFRSIRRIFDLRLARATSYSEKDRVLALFAPLSLLSLPPIWLTLITIGYTFIFWGTGIKSWTEAFTLAGSSLLTLGFAKGPLLIHTILSFTAATIGLIMVALLIAYLPTMYAAFSKREVAVNQLSVRADSPPSPVELLLRFYRLERLNQLALLWEKWEDWFTELEESHTSLAALVFFRSPNPNESWVNAAGVILDCAALRLALLDLPDDIQTTFLPDGNQVPSDPQAAITIRAGFIALRRIADYFNVTYNPTPHFPEDSISISQDEFFHTVQILRNFGIPLKTNLDQAWQDFAGWRVNYDSVLLALQRITVAPPAPWLKDQMGTAPRND